MTIDPISNWPNADHSSVGFSAKTDVGIEDVAFDDDLRAEMDNSSINVEINVHTPDDSPLGPVTRFSNEPDRQIQFRSALTEANEIESQMTRPLSLPPSYDTPSFPAPIRPTTLPPPYTSYTSQESIDPPPPYTPNPVNQIFTSVTAGATTVENQREVQETPPENHAYLKNHENEVHQKFINVVFPKESRNQNFLDSGTPEIENRIKRAVLTLDRNFGEYLSLGFQSKEQVLLFFERMQDRLFQVGTDKETKCRENQIKVEDAVNRAISDARAENREAQIQVLGNEVTIDGVQVPIDGDIEYTGVSFSELNDVARNYIDDLVAGRINDYRSVFQAPTREDVESGRRTSMERMSFTEHEERRKQNWVMLEGGQWVVVPPKTIEIDSTNQKIESKEHQSNPQHSKLTSRADSEVRLEAHNKEISEEQKDRRLEQIKISQSQLENSVKRREFIEKILEELRNQSSSVVFILTK